MDKCHVEKKVGTGAEIVVKCGFEASRVKVINTEGLCTLEYLSGMPDDSGFKTVTDGTCSFITSGGATVSSLSVSIGADADINVDGEDLYFFIQR